MAKKINSQTMLELLERSRLLGLEQLQRAVADYEATIGHPVGEDPEPLLEYLVSRELITPWHAENLLRGKYKGYFLGKFKLLGLLGSGGMGSVYLAEHTLMRRKQAVKVLPKKRVSDTSYLERFRLEALATAALDHPSIVRLYDIDNEGDIHYLVMEYVAGRDLQAIVASEGPLSYLDAARCVAQAARGLQYAHDVHLIHRDVKPANLLVDEHGGIKILDLGLALYAREGEESLTLLHNENVLGTADYLAPEQALSSHDVDSRADIYSLGCTLYFLVTGRPPFPQGTLAQRIAMHQTKMPPDIREFRPDCPLPLRNICVKMIQKDPDHRYRHMHEVADALENWVRTTETVSMTVHEELKVQPETARRVARQEVPVASPLGPSVGSGSDILRQASSRGGQQSGSDNRSGAAAEAAQTDPPGETVRDSAVEIGHQRSVRQTAGSASEGGQVDLGPDVFPHAASSQGSRLLREQRRAREQHLGRLYRGLFVAAAIAVLCAAAGLFSLWLFGSGDPSPAPGPGSTRPVLRPRN